LKYINNNINSHFDIIINNYDTDNINIKKLNNIIKNTLSKIHHLLIMDIYIQKKEY
jgi:hypothetical protein